MQIKRQGIIVWFQHRKNIKQIRRFGNLIYVSKKMRYAVLYVDQTEVDTIIEKMSKLSFISKIEVSYKPFLKTYYENALSDEAKIYDYKIGILVTVVYYIIDKRKVTEIITTINV